MGTTALEMEPRWRYIRRMTSGPEFEWDEHKAAENIANNRSAFEDVVYFDLGSALVVEDERRDYGEQRWTAIGLVRDRPHVLVYTRRGAKLRVISFRKANDREIKRHDRYAQIKD